MQAKALLDQFMQLAEELQLLSNPEDTSRWMEAEMMAYARYEQMDAWRLGQISDEAVAEFREMVAEWAGETVEAD